jgi:hypothetical protein
MVLLAALFVVSRAAAFWAGMRYAEVETVVFWQFLDIGQLRHHLLRSLLNLHAQPPLFNAMLGISEKLGGAHYGDLMLAQQMLLSLLGFLALYEAMARLRVHPVFNVVAVAVLMLSPATIAFEFDALYTTTVFALLCFMALATVWYVQSRSQYALYSVIGLAVVLTLLRSTYHWIWLALLMTVLAWQLPASRRQIVRAGSVGLLLAMLWPAKNLLLFQHFVSSTWGPYSMASHWSFLAERQPEKGWIENGQLHTFKHFNDDTDGEMRRWLKDDWAGPPTGYPELDDAVKRHGGAMNWNSLAMMRMHDAQAKDDLFLLRHDFKNYALSVETAAELYFRPSSRYLALQIVPGVSSQYQTIAPYDHAVQRICCYIFGPPQEAFGAAEPSHASLLERVRRCCWGAVLANLLVLLCGVSFWKSRLWARDPDRRVALLLMTVTIGYLFVVVTLLEIGENMRFRFETEGLVLIVVVVFLQTLWDRRRTAAMVE